MVKLFWELPLAVGHFPLGGGDVYDYLVRTT